MKNTDEALAGILNKLADKFGTTVDHLYAIMLRQAFIDGIENLIALVIVCSLSAVFFTWLNKDYKSFTPKTGGYYNEDYWDENMALSIFAPIFAMVTISVFFVCGIAAINCFFNPEYYALHQIIK